MIRFGGTLQGQGFVALPLFEAICLLVTLLGTPFDSWHTLGPVDPLFCHSQTSLDCIQRFESFAGKGLMSCSGFCFALGLSY